MNVVVITTGHPTHVILLEEDGLVIAYGEKKEIKKH